MAVKRGDPLIEDSTVMSSCILYLYLGGLIYIEGIDYFWISTNFTDEAFLRTKLNKGNGRGGNGRGGREYKELERTCVGVYVQG